MRAYKNLSTAVLGELACQSSDVGRNFAADLDVVRSMLLHRMLYYVLGRVVARFSFWTDRTHILGRRRTAEHIVFRRLFRLKARLGEPLPTARSADQRARLLADIA